MSKSGAIPRKWKKPEDNISTLHHDTQILVGQDPSEPLDTKLLCVIANGVQTKVPALHKSWCTDKVLMHYSPAPLDCLDVPGALDAWLEQMEYFRKDLEWILGLSHHRFWSELVYGRQIQNCLISFLSQAPRWYDHNCHSLDEQRRKVFDDTIQPIQVVLHRMVLLTHIRMATHKESKSCHINPSAFKDMVYENFIFDVCQIMDLCVLFGEKNKEILHKMLDNIFKLQPKYLQDLEVALSAMVTALDNAEIRLGIMPEPSMSIQESKPNSDTFFEDVRAVIYYLLDTFNTMYCLLEVFPPAAQPMLKCDLGVRLAMCYERVVPLVSNQLSSVSLDDFDRADISLIKEQFRLLRVFAVAVFRNIIQITAFTKGDGIRTCDMNEALLIYHQTMSSCLSEKIFLGDYHNIYGFTNDLSVFKEHDCDSTTLDFLQDAFTAVLQDMNMSLDQRSLTNGLDSKNTPTDGQTDPTGMSHYAETGSAEVDAVQLAELVSTVSELLPELGAGFITACFKHFNYSSEEVINALLENNLPPHLATMERTLAVADLPETSAQSLGVPSASLGTQSEDHLMQDSFAYQQVKTTSVIDRANVYNDDEFDVFSSRTHVDKSKIHRGKQNKPLSEDTQLVNKVRSLARRYEERGGRSIYEEEEDEEEVQCCSASRADYDDEYDDTYDDRDVGSLDANTEILKPAGGRSSIFGRGALNAPLPETSDETDEDESPQVNSVGPELPIEEDEEDFARRRGLRKGIGGVEFMLELRQSGGVISNKPPKIERNLPASHYYSKNVKSRSEHRNRPRLFHRDHHKPDRPTSDMVPDSITGLADTDQPIENNTEEEEQLEDAPDFLLEDPALVRERLATSRAASDAARNRGGNRGRRQFSERAEQSEDSWDQTGGNRSGTRPKTYTKGSGKAWRQGQNEDSRGSKGGKWKEDSNHGHAQDLNYRKKMEHKNKFKKQGAQIKFARNNF